MRYFIRFSYLGTDFHGSQRQPNGITVQEVMEEALHTIIRQPVSLTFAGRTDAGVHAGRMYAHFDFDGTMQSRLLVSRLNSLLPYSIAVEDIVPVRSDVHARFSALSRSYEYRITTQKTPFRYRQVAQVAAGLDFETMNEAAAMMLGQHDFASFCRSHTDVKTMLCTVTEAQWSVEDIKRGDAVFYISANRFLRNMVRAVVGTLFDVGRGKMSVTDFQQVIDAKNRCEAGQSAPAEGLFLTDINYPKDVFLV